ncbi:MAG: hypothetical protein R6U44_06410 [Archaeoglobaceae archaeon]
MSAENTELMRWDDWEDKRSFQNVFLLNLLTELEKKDCEVRGE